MEHKIKHMFLHDYQGNILAVVKNNQLLQWNNYYPDGTPFSASSSLTNRFLFSEKEIDRMYGLDWYDFHARQYSPILDRFTSLDPHAEKYYGYSPYAFCRNNPVRFTDPTGMDWVSKIINFIIISAI